MSPVLAFAISITLLTNDYAGEKARIVHHRITSVEQCRAWAKTMGAEPMPTVDPTTGRKITSRRFECAPIRIDELQAMVNQAGAH